MKENWVKIFTEEGLGVQLANGLNEDYCPSGYAGGIDCEPGIAVTVRVEVASTYVYVIEYITHVYEYEDNLTWAERQTKAVEYAVDFVADELIDTCPSEWLATCKNFAVLNTTTGVYEERVPYKNWPLMVAERLAWRAERAVQYKNVHHEPAPVNFKG